MKSRFDPTLHSDATGDPSVLCIVFTVCADPETLNAACRAVRSAGLISAVVSPVDGGVFPTKTYLAESIRAAKGTFVVRRDAKPEDEAISLTQPAKELARYSGRAYGSAAFGATFHENFLEWFRRTRPAELCLVVSSGIEPEALEFALAQVFTEAVVLSPGLSSEAPVPYKDLFDFYFRHIQHEANWVNSRFMWCMFANSALIGFVGSFKQHAATKWAIVAGLAVTGFTWALQVVTLSSEQSAINKITAVIAEWKQRVPQVKNLLYDTPAGGGSLWNHRIAKWLTHGILGALIAFWCACAWLWRNNRLA